MQNPDKQAKVCDLPARLPVRVRTQKRRAQTGLEKQIDPVRCLIFNGVDQMVYKLYDLTSEEIAIVEGKK
jgi:hypothetical protein